MDTYASYFSYAFDCVCGIPRIKLMGSIEDWQHIRARVEVLETYQLSWSVTRLRPVLDELRSRNRGRGNQTSRSGKRSTKPLNAYATYAVHRVDHATCFPISMILRIDGRTTSWIRPVQIGRSRLRRA